MAGDSKKLQPIIVKRVRKAEHGHHGGAWKIAYADFVTAMMAFFLLMWLLGSTTEGDKKGIADYFNTPLRMAVMQSGTNSGDSSQVFKGGGEDLTRETGEVRRASAADQKRVALSLQTLKAEQARAEMAMMEELKRKIEEKIANHARLAQLRSQLRLDLSPDGLRIQIVDDASRPMFASGSPVVQPYMRELLAEIAGMLGQVSNRLTLEGHTDSVPYSSGDRGYSNWELSADRANASRRELVAAGLPDDRILRVQGLAASLPLMRDDPQAPTNRRISIMVMNREAEQRFFRVEQDTPQVSQSQLPSIAPSIAPQLAPLAESARAAKPPVPASTETRR